MSTTQPSEVTLPHPARDHQPTSSPIPSDPGLIELVIKPRPGWIAVNWGELVQQHELFYTLISRDLMVRYKQTVLGVAWAVIQPVLSMVVFTVIFGMLVGIKTEVPYALFAYAGVVPWMFFSNAVTASSLSLITQQNLITKIYFPRMYVPAAAVGGFLVDLAIGLALFAFLMPIYHFAPGWGLLALPFVVVLTFATTLGVGLATSAMTILYRDLRFVVPFVLQIMIYVSGVQIPMGQFPRWVQLVAAINPMFGIINAYRSSILGMPWDFVTLGMAIVSTAILLTFGLFFFRKTERLIADIA